VCQYGKSGTSGRRRGYRRDRVCPSPVGNPDTRREALTKQRFVSRRAQTKCNLSIRGKLWLTALCLLIPSLQSWGVLGEDAALVAADGARINASSRLIQRESYTIHELRSPSGITVREYANASGRVFAVAWKGPFLPDMKQLLGTHFEEFQKAAQAQNRRGGHGPLVIQQPGLIVELGGHMRSFVGRAYLPDEMPAEVRSGEIR